MSHTKVRTFALAAGLLLATSGGLHAQTPAPPQAANPVATPVPAANPADVQSVDAIIAALYDVISGPVGQKRDWNRMRSLFIPHARMMPAGQRPNGSVAIRLLEVNDYIATSGPYLETNGFREREIARKTEQFGHIVHVWSTYEGRMETDSTVLRGINSIQLMNDGTRWWVVSIYWEHERPDMPLPAQYLPAARQ
jgi:hypothetical protein